MNLGVAKGGPRSPTQIEMPQMIKIITTKPNVSSLSVSVSIFAYNSFHVQQNNIIIDNQLARASSNQTFANQFK